MTTDCHDGWDLGQDEWCGARCARVVRPFGPSAGLPSASHQGEIWAAGGWGERGMWSRPSTRCEHTPDAAPLSC